MSIKQSFLNSLKGLFLDQAEALVESEGLTVWSIPYTDIICGLARPGTVILWMTDTNQVQLAVASDPLELEDDAP